MRQVTWVESKSGKQSEKQPEKKPEQKPGAKPGDKPAATADAKATTAAGAGKARVNPLSAMIAKSLEKRVSS